MFAIDTNVASELMRPEPAPAVAAWVAERDAREMYLTAVTEAELRYGVAILPAGRRRSTLEAAMNRWLDQGFGEHILPFDSAAARAYARIAADRRRAGRPIGEADCQIAAICRSRGAVLITRNVRDFDGAGIVVADPWGAPGDGPDARERRTGHPFDPGSGRPPETGSGG